MVLATNPHGLNSISGTHDGRRELTPTGCLLSSTHTLWHVHEHTQTHTVSAQKERKKTSVRLAATFPLIIIVLGFEVDLGSPWSQSSLMVLQLWGWEFWDWTFLCWVGGIVTNFKGVWTYWFYFISFLYVEMWISPGSPGWPRLVGCVDQDSLRLTKICLLLPFKYWN